MAKQYEYGQIPIELELSCQKKRIDELEKSAIALNKKYVDRGKSLNKLWERGKQLIKDIVELKKYCGKLTYDISVLHLENRIIIPPATKQIECQAKQFLVRDILRQLINESGYDLEFKVLQMRYPTKPDLTIKGKIV